MIDDFSIKSPHAAGIVRCMIFWYEMANRLKVALKQAYMDGGCREDEATEMADCFFIDSDEDKQEPQ